MLRITVTINLPGDGEVERSYWVHSLDGLFDSLMQEWPQATSMVWTITR